MDRRCLYGHRVNASFHYAIERDQCPVCGAELISLDGYRIARQLAQSVPMDGGMAFRTVKVIELSYVLQPRQPSPAVAPTSPGRSRAANKKSPQKTYSGKKQYSS